LMVALICALPALLDPVGSLCQRMDAIIAPTPPHRLVSFRYSVSACDSEKFLDIWRASRR